MRKLIGFYNYTVILTYMGFVSGVYGIFLAAGYNNTLGAVLCLLFAGLCDAFDGKVASTMKRTDEEKRFGIQIDSLSDLVCFGILPAAIGYSAGMKFWWCYIILALYALCGLIRLAYYNVTEETRQKEEDGARKYYMGLPITTASIISPIVYAICAVAGLNNSGFLYIIYSVIIGLTAAAFVAPFKVKKLKTLGLIVVVLLGVAAAAAILVALL